ncbi:unnamed protein product [Ixodes pacificus]
MHTNVYSKRGMVRVASAPIICAQPVVECDSAPPLKGCQTKAYVGEAGDPGFNCYTCPFQGEHRTAVQSPITTARGMLQGSRRTALAQLSSTEETLDTHWGQLPAV